MKNNVTTGFRDDINALRAIAVLSVVFFHFHIPGFSGGFVGVDVFFAVSGFLMTSILIKGLERESVLDSYRAWVKYIWSFYMAREKRIMPALLLLVFVLLVIGWWALPQGDYKLLSVHSLYALTFLSNVRLWQESGYFDSASHEKWLLHTWSLSVEWQFYLVLPLVLVVLWRWLPGRKPAAIIMFSGFLLSFSASVWLTSKDPSSAFFLLPTRAWEMLVGGLVFLLGSTVKFPLYVIKILQFVGMLCVLFSILVFQPSTLWPGMYVLLPVFGTALVLFSAHQAAWVRNPGIQWLGLSSYSLYLWHWPVYVALVYLGLDDIATFIILATILSMLLGAASYHLVENPSRLWFKKNKSVWLPPSILLIFSTMVAVPALWIYINSGVSGRMPAAVERAAAESENFNKRRAECHALGGVDFPWCTYGGDNIKAIVVGDSHASAVMTAVLEAAKGASNFSGKTGIYGTSYTSCPTLFGVKMYREDLKCSEFNDFVFKKINGLSSDIPLVIVNRTTGALFGDQHITSPELQSPFIYFNKPWRRTTTYFLKEFEDALINTTCTMAEERKVYLVTPFPEMPVDVPKVMARNIFLGKSGEVSITFQDYVDRHGFVIDKQNKVAQACSNVTVLNSSSVLCRGGVCKGSEDGYPLYYDDNHLTERGNKKLVAMFGEIFKGDLESAGVFVNK